MDADELGENGWVSATRFRHRTDQRDLVLEVPGAPHFPSSRVARPIPERAGLLSFPFPPRLQALSRAPEEPWKLPGSQIDSQP